MTHKKHEKISSNFDRFISRYELKNYLLIIGHEGAKTVSIFSNAEDPDFENMFDKMLQSTTDGIFSRIQELAINPTEENIEILTPTLRDPIVSSLKKSLRIKEQRLEYNDKTGAFYSSHISEKPLGVDTNWKTIVTGISIIDVYEFCKYAKKDLHVGELPMREIQTDEMIDFFRSWYIENSDKVLKLYNQE